MRKHRNQPYEFDAAMSFAGENRELAEAITRELQKLGRDMFYDRDHNDKWVERFYRIGLPSFVAPKGLRFIVSGKACHHGKRLWIVRP
jgi:hypothetical protein